VTSQELAERRAGLIVREAVGRHVRHGGSTWQSLHRGTGSVEAAYLNGEIVELGHRHDVATPVNALLLHVVEAMARSGEAPGGRRARDLVDAIRSPPTSTGTG
jgi:2-dehydropantoate 2-reductase